MRKTTNYNLSQYDATDCVTRAAFNADNAAVDMALKAIATAAANAGSAASAAQTTANSASSAAATAQSTANTAKSNAATAQSTANTAKTNAATAQFAAESAKTTADSALALAQAAGNCFVEHGTYTGNGYTRRTFTFSKPPLAILMRRADRLKAALCIAVRDAPMGFVDLFGNYFYVNLLWSGNSVEFGAELPYDPNATGGTHFQLNEADVPYAYVALFSA